MCKIWPNINLLVQKVQLRLQNYMPTIRVLLRLIVGLFSNGIFSEHSKNFHAAERRIQNPVKPLRATFLLR